LQRLTQKAAIAELQDTDVKSNAMSDRRMRRDAG